MCRTVQSVRSTISLSPSKASTNSLYTPCWFSSCSFGYSDAESLLQSLPGCAVAFLSVWWGTWAAGRYNCRGLVIIALIIPTLLGGALMAWLPADNKSGLLAGINLINTVGSSMFVAMLSKRRGY